jgi:ketosteroid isomerase-like protein
MIFAEAEKPALAEREESSDAALPASEPIRAEDKQAEIFPAPESVPFVVKIPTASEAYFVKNETNAVELIAANEEYAVEPIGAKEEAVEPIAPQTVDSGVAGIKMREAVDTRAVGIRMREAVNSRVGGVKMREAQPSQQQVQPALIPGDSHAPQRAAQRVAPKQFSMLVGAAPLALAILGGLFMFWNSQQAEPIEAERAAKETPIASAPQTPPTSETNNDAVLTTESGAEEANEATPIAAKESPLTAPKRDVQNQPRRETPADGAQQPNETIINQLASEKPAATIERGSSESAEKPGTGDDHTKLNSSLDQWITATNARDVERQMSYYAPRVSAYYQTRNASPESVRAEKKRIFDHANAVDIRAGKPEITVSRDGRSATMRFRKKYAITQGQKNRSGEVIQELQWVKSGGDWKIVSERDVKVVNR